MIVLHTDAPVRPFLMFLRLLYLADGTRLQVKRFYLTALPQRVQLYCWRTAAYTYERYYKMIGRELT